MSVHSLVRQLGRIGIIVLLLLLTFSLIVSTPGSVKADSTPAATVGLDAVAASAASVSLSWTDNSTNESGFVIERTYTSDFSSNVTSLSIGANLTEYSDSSVTASTTYYYRIFAFNASGNSTPSNIAMVTTPAPSTLNAPGSLTATLVNTGRINLSWQDNSNNETGFRIYSATNEAFTANKVAITVGPNVRTYSDYTVYPDDTFYYKVTAFDGSGESAASNVVSVFIPASTVGIPPSPSGLAATAATGTQAALTWNFSAGTSLVGFQAERATNIDFTNGYYSFVIAPDLRAYSDETGAGGTYYYRISAFNAVGVSQPSNTAQVTIQGAQPALTAPSPAPANLVLNAVNSTQINLSWTDTTTNEAGFRIERGENSEFTLNPEILNVAANATAYSDTSVFSDTLYYYRVFAYNAAGNSTASNVAFVVTPATAVVVSVPAAPASLSAVAVNSTRVSLSWTYANNNTATGFRIERALNNAFTSGKAVLQAAVSARTFLDTSASPATTYYYRIFAFNSSGDSSASNIVSVTTPSLTASTTQATTISLPAPSSLAAIAISSSQVNLIWAYDNNTNASGFRIERAQDNTFTTGKIVLQAGINNRTYIDSSVAANSTYYYRIYAIAENGDSQPAISIPVLTPGSTAQFNLSGLAGGTFELDASGFVSSYTELNSPDNKVVIIISAQSRLLDAQGNALNSISFSEAEPPSAAPAGMAVISSYSLGPDASSFEPFITLKISYNPQNLPDGSNENELKIARWDGSNWQILDSQVDTAAKTVSAQIRHFSYYAVLAKEQEAQAGAVAGVSITGISVTPETIKTNDEITIRATVRNNTTETSSGILVLKVNGLEESRLPVELAAGEKLLVSFVTHKEKPGIYEFDINGIGGNTFTVERAGMLPDWGLPAIFAGAILIVLIIIGFIFVRLTISRRQVQPVYIEPQNQPPKRQVQSFESEDDIARLREYVKTKMS